MLGIGMLGIGMLGIGMLGIGTLEAAVDVDVVFHTLTTLSTGIE
jgi:hypothetical protein